MPYIETTNQMLNWDDFIKTYALITYCAQLEAYAFDAYFDLSKNILLLTYSRNSSTYLLWGQITHPQLVGNSN
jgi:hypothetical protein